MPLLMWYLKETKKVKLITLLQLRVPILLQCFDNVSIPSWISTAKYWLWGKWESICRSMWIHCRHLDFEFSTHVEELIVKILLIVWGGGRKQAPSTMDACPPKAIWCLNNKKRRAISNVVERQSVEKFRLPTQHN